MPKHAVVQRNKSILCIGGGAATSFTAYLVTLNKGHHRLTLLVGELEDRRDNWGEPALLFRGVHVDIHTVLEVLEVDNVLVGLRVFLTIQLLLNPTEKRTQLSILGLKRFLQVNHGHTQAKHMD